ncbi:AraC family transcriptional regulator [Nocardiopsis sp. JB363]|uniref:AraC family transcriptional regulator n=1 Tax=Nocardiopsis sp. JB363 TaxID=1434837 RepID=UPI000B3603CC|nr:AraC family transcriptional regulator [Nocardiopsis sp. JB363]
MGTPSEVHPTVEDPRVEQARYWRFSGLPGTELLTARFVTTAFTRHTHPTYTIGMITGGIEEYTHPRGRSRVGPGGLAVVAPGEVHTGHAGVPEGWDYRVFYPSPEVVEEIGRELGMRGTPGFRESGIDAPEVSRVLVAAHRAAERGDRLTSSALARQGLAMLLRSHGRERVPDAAERTARPEVLRARDLLARDLTAPPTLEELAAHVDLGPFALNRAFRARYGLPPHAYLNQLRVDRARALLLEGRRVGEVATEVGFADQPHLTRHFRRHLGVPPGAYRRDLGDRPPRGG